MDRFEEQVQAHMRPLERYIRFRIANREDSEDVLQQVLIAAYLGRETAVDAAMYKAWLIGIAKNKCNDYFRRTAKRMEIPIEALEATKFPVGMHGVTTRIAVRDTLESLGDTDRQILYLSFFKNLPQAEIAKLLNIPLGTVKSRLFHAKQHFKEQYPYETKGETTMKETKASMPEYLPDYSIKQIDAEPFAPIWEELMGWFIVPRLGETCSWAMYDFPKRKRTEQCDLKVIGKAKVHGVEGVEIEAVEYEPKAFNSVDGSDRTERRFVAQLTDTHTRYLAESHIENGVRECFTFLDGDEFLQNWGFGKDNCGNETHLAPKGLIRKNGSVVETEKGLFMIDVVGRFEVQINGKTYETICVIDAGAYEEGVLTEQYLDRNGRTILWRRFNRADWMIESFKRPWTELLPDNERLTVDGETYVHWYDCITDYIL